MAVRLYCITSFEWRFDFVFLKSFSKNKICFQLVASTTIGSFICLKMFNLKFIVFSQPNLITRIIGGQFGERLLVLCDADGATVNIER